MRPISLRANAKRVMGCAKTAGFVISLESLKRLFRAGIASNVARPIAQHGFNLIFRFAHVLQRSAIAYDNAIRGNLDDVAPS